MSRLENFNILFVSLFVAIKTGRNEMSALETNITNPARSIANKNMSEMTSCFHFAFVKSRRSYG
jgi:hypothetical protein